MKVWSGIIHMWFSVDKNNCWWIDGTKTMVNPSDLFDESELKEFEENQKEYEETREKE